MCERTLAPSDGRRVAATAVDHPERDGATHRPVLVADERGGSEA